MGSETPSEERLEPLLLEMRRFFIEGDQWHEDGPEYRLVNLLEALKIAPDTGDWHAEARSLFRRLLAALADRKQLKPKGLDLLPCGG